MKLSFKLLFIFILFFNFLSYGQKIENKLKKASQIVENNIKMLNNIEQLLVVFNDISENHKATLVAMKKSKDGWTAASFAIPAGVGYNGFADLGKKREGDGKSPTGLFSLGQLFCYDTTNVQTLMPSFQTTTEDKWIDDPNSVDYNKHIRGETNAMSYENLKLQSDHYKYCLVIEYNTHPIIKGNGSAIFFHLGNEYEETAGCVSITETNMEIILKWLKPKHNPAIIMGNDKILLDEIK